MNKIVTRLSQGRLSRWLTVIAVTLILEPLKAEETRPLTLGLYQDVTGFEIGTVKSMSQAGLTVATSIMEGLFSLDYDHGNAILPRLATSFEFSSDNLSALVHLRPGVRFHDGTPCDADSVAFHYNRLLDPTLGLGLKETTLEPLLRAEAVDRLTVRFVLKQPWFGFQTVLAIDHPMNLIGSPTAIRADPALFNRRPVGTGPFILQEWLPNDRIVLARNPDYWDPAIPRVDRAVFRIIPDENTRYQTLRAGGIDVAWVENPANITAAKKDPDLRVYESLDASAIIWLFNHRRAPFDDRRARSAVIHAFDSDTLANGYFRGAAGPSDGFVTKTSFWYCENLPWPRYDPAAARTLLSSLNGPLRFTVNSYATPDGRRLNAILQEFMREVGIEVEIETFENSRIFPKALRGEFEITQFRIADYGGEPDLPYSFIIYKLMGYENPKLREMIASARSASDIETRKQIYCRIAGMLSDDAVMLYPVHSYSYAVGSRHVSGVSSPQNRLIRIRSMQVNQ